MARITRRTFVAAPSSLVWDLAQDFAQWHPRLNIYTGGPESSPELVVTVLEQDDEAHTLSYSMPEPPFPITDHRARISITADTETTCYAEWSAEFETDPGIMQLLEDQLGDDIFKLALDRLASAAQDEHASRVTSG
ncbi:SRPBCC family protein [Aeromicrobium sp. CTD01-1L150]|uniref:SRPBCC family protein n=1 Tax=Aeromicrobium sp. CTD01-1L150 TaxID=3341830 RepID=UPI0035C1DB18